MKPIPVSIVVSDPWDVGESLSWTPMKGEVVRVEPGQYGGRALVRFVKPLTYRGILYPYAAVSPRHEGHDVMELVAGGKLCVAVSCVSDEEAQSGDPLDMGTPSGGLAFIADIDPVT